MKWATRFKVCLPIYDTLPHTDFPVTFISSTRSLKLTDKTFNVYVEKNGITLFDFWKY